MPSDVVELLRELVAIDSVNPSLVPGAAGEDEIAGFVEGWAREAGLEVRRLEATPGRPSVLVRAPGTGGGRTLLLCAHLDTVSTEGMDGEPLVPQIEDDRLYGRGAYDMKAGLAAALVACRDAATLGLAGDVVVAAVADEEHSSFGVQEILGHVSADAAIVTEPTELRVAVAHKGFVWSEVEVRGVAAHGSRPHLGVDAIVGAGRVLAAVGELDGQLQARTHPLLGRGSVHAGTISGGEETSSYPARCGFTLERRTLPGESAADVEAELAAVLQRCRVADPHLDVTATTTLVREPLDGDPAGELALLVRDAAAGVLAQPPDVVGVSYWADSAFLAAAGIPTVLFGPAGEGAHAASEWVSIASSDQVVTTLTRVAERFCA